MGAPCFSCCRKHGALKSLRPQDAPDVGCDVRALQPFRAIGSGQGMARDVVRADVLK